MSRELLIGCGASRVNILDRPFQNLTTLDINPNHQPDVEWDLTRLPLPFQDEEFDEIHAYEVLEHTGQQGDFKFFFAQFSDFWRILKPGGRLVGSCPASGSPWVWGDPSHSRVIQLQTLIFLDQEEYTRQVGKTAMSDFRYIYKADFKIQAKENDGVLIFVLEAVKPSRISVP